MRAGEGIRASMLLPTRFPKAPIPNPARKKKRARIGHPTVVYGVGFYSPRVLAVKKVLSATQKPSYRGNWSRSLTYKLDFIAAPNVYYGVLPLVYPGKLVCSRTRWFCRIK